MAWRRLLFCGWILSCVVALVGFNRTRDWGQLKQRYLNSLAVEQLGGVGYVFFDVVQNAQWKWQELRLTRLDLGPYRAYLAGLAAERRALPVKPVPRKHVILLQMESVDGLVIGARNDGKPVMPFLESLARCQIYFSNVIDNTAGGRTTDGETLVLTSQVPLRSRPVYVSQPLGKVPSLPRVLKGEGYECWSMHGYVGHFWNRAAAHKQLGYDREFFLPDLDASDRIGWGVSDRSVLHQAAQRLAAATGPTLAHVILLTNHYPYHYLRERSGAVFEGIEDDYIRSVRYVDDSIAAFFAELDQLGLKDNCLVAIYSDHDSGITGKLEDYLDVSPRVFSDTVPLILTGFGAPPRRIDQVAGLQDVPVMLLEELGIPVPLTFTGHSLGHQGKTVAALYGPLESAPNGTVRPYSLPIESRLLTLIALHQPDRL